MKVGSLPGSSHSYAAKMPQATLAENRQNRRGPQISGHGTTKTDKGLGSYALLIVIDLKWIYLLEYEASYSSFGCE